MVEVIAVQIPLLELPNVGSKFSLANTANKNVAQSSSAAAPQNLANANTAVNLTTNLQTVAPVPTTAAAKAATVLPLWAKILIGVIVATLVVGAVAGVAAYFLIAGASTTTTTTATTTTATTATTTTATTATTTTTASVTTTSVTTTSSASTTSTTSATTTTTSVTTTSVTTTTTASTTTSATTTTTSATTTSTESSTTSVTTTTTSVTTTTSSTSTTSATTTTTDTTTSSTTSATTTTTSVTTATTVTTTASVTTSTSTSSSSTTTSETTITTTPTTTSVTTTTTTSVTTTATTTSTTSATTTTTTTSATTTTTTTSTTSETTTTTTTSVTTSTSTTSTTSVTTTTTTTSVTTSTSTTSTTSVTTTTTTTSETTSTSSTSTTSVTTTTSVTSSTSATSTTSVTTSTSTTSTSSATTSTTTTTATTTTTTTSVTTITTTTTVTTTTTTSVTTTTTTTTAIPCVNMQWNMTGVVVAGTTGAFGGAANQLSQPWNLFVDSNRNMYIADAANHRIQFWPSGATSGTTIAGITGGWGSGTNRLDMPSDIYVYSNGNFLVADRNNNRVQFFNSGSTSGTSGIIASTGWGGTGRFYSVQPDSANRILASDQSNSALWRNNTVPFGYTGAGGAWNQLNGNQGLAVDPVTNEVYIANTNQHTIVRWTPGTNFVTVVAGTNGVQGSSSTTMRFPVGVKMDSFGNLYAVDNNNHRIQLYCRFPTVSSTARTIIGTGVLGSTATQLNYPSGLALDNDLNIYVADNANHRIIRFTRIA